MLERAKLSVKVIAEHYLELTKKGKDYWALCPFHDDTRASLSISEEKNIFKCFSCGVAGDGISFIMRKEKTNFRQALIQAHKILQLPIDNIIDSKTFQEEQQKKQLLKFNEFVTQFFEKQLFSAIGRQALNYLTQERKLTIELIKQMRIGYAPKGQALLIALERIKKASQEYQFIDSEFLSKAGIFVSEPKKQINSSTVSFQNRIVLPIFSLNNEIIGFSSRALPNSKTDIKYLHSRETLLFKKAQLLYNLPTLSNLKKESVYLFEGCFDLFAFMLLQPKCKALALMGRELSNDCIKLLQQKEVKKMVLMLDADRAGITASLKIIQQLLKEGIQPYALRLNFQNAKDFAELYCSNPNLKISEPIYFVDWIKQNWAKSINQSTPETELISLNQIVNSLLNSLFMGEINNSLRLQPKLEAQFAIDSLSAIFSLYELIQLSEQERKIISAKHKSYLEAINLHFLTQAKTNLLSRVQVLPQRQEESKNIISNFSSIFKLWATLIQTEKSQKIIKQKLQDWQSSSLEDYSELFRWILLPEEILFLTQLQKNLSIKSSNIAISKNFQNNLFFSKLWDFFELYYSLIHLLLDKSEKYLQADNLTNWPIKLKWLKKIETDREILRNKSSNIFNRLLELEKTKS